MDAAIIGLVLGLVIGAGCRRLGEDIHFAVGRVGTLARRTAADDLAAARIFLEGFSAPVRRESRGNSIS